MKKALYHRCIGLVAAALVSTLVACDQSPQANPNDTIVGKPPDGGAGRAPSSSPDSSSLKGLMTALAKGPNSLTTVIGQELNADPPPWDQMAKQSAEYVTLVGKLPTFDPPKGTKESWNEQTSAYAKLATDLQNAVKARDADSALNAHGQITRSCMSCHRAHRVMGPGGPGGGGFGPPGGAPPGGYPGGPPPGGGSPPGGQGAGPAEGPPRG